MKYELANKKQRSFSPLNTFGDDLSSLHYKHQITAVVELFECRVHHNCLDKPIEKLNMIDFNYFRKYYLYAAFILNQSYLEFRYERNNKLYVGAH
jgi:hypothetical protein